MLIRILLLMVLCHIIDDFVLQPICLSKLKQKEAWKDYDEMYRNDYKMALAMHSISWAIMIMLPIIFFSDIDGVTVLLLTAINAFVHYCIDDAKANMKEINLVQDQTVHLLQILMTFAAFVIL